MIAQEGICLLFAEKIQSEPVIHCDCLLSERCDCLKVWCNRIAQTGFQIPGEQVAPMEIPSSRGRRDRGQLNLGLLEQVALGSRSVRFD